MLVLSNPYCISYKNDFMLIQLQRVKSFLFWMYLLFNNKLNISGIIMQTSCRTKYHLRENYTVSFEKVPCSFCNAFIIQNILELLFIYLFSLVAFFTNSLYIWDSHSTLHFVFLLPFSNFLGNQRSFGINIALFKHGGRRNNASTTTGMLQ